MAENRPVFSVGVGGLSLGVILAVIVLILVIVLAIIGKMDYLEAILIGLLALARLT